MRDPGKASHQARRFLAVAAAVLLLWDSAGCSYLKWRKSKSQQRSRLAKTPGDLVLLKEYAPQDCFTLAGRVAVPPEQKEPILVAAFGHESRQLVGSRVIGNFGYYPLLLPGGVYDVAFFVDFNHDGYFESNEVVGRTPADAPVVVGAKEASDGTVVEAPDVGIDLGRPSSIDIVVRVKVAPRPMVVESVDDPIFSPEMGKVGVYQPNQFLVKSKASSSRSAFRTSRRSSWSSSTGSTDARISER
jgi:hypothetical protein